MIFPTIYSLLSNLVKLSNVTKCMLKASPYGDLTFWKKYGSGQDLFSWRLRKLGDFVGTQTEMIELSLTAGDINQEYLNHVKKVNDVFYDQVKISDQKAAYIFTFMLAFLISSSEGRGVFTWERYIEGHITVMLVSGVMALSSIFCILSAIIVVLPRRVGITTSLFWGAWPAHRPLLEQAAERADIKYLFYQYLQNADALSMIARQKYRFVAFAFRGLIVTVVAYILLLLAS